MRNLTIAMILACMFFGCASKKKYERALESWVNHDVDELVQSWGPPVSEYKLNNGSRILTYVTEGGSTGYANYNPYTRSIISTSSNRYCKTNFTVDAFNRVVYWQYEGNMCRSFAEKRTEAFTKSGEKLGGTAGESAWSAK